jgi:hypothetical protein
MKHAIIVLAVLFFAILGISQTPKDKRIAVKNGALDAAPASSRKNNQQHAASPPSQTTSIYNQSSPPEHNGDAKQSQDAIDVERQVARFTGYLAIVGLFQLVVLAVQAVLFRQQKNIMEQHRVSLEKLATAASDNAEAAKLNARAVMNAERPLLLIDIKLNDEGPGYKVAAHNPGRTPAIFQNGDCCCGKHPADFVPPEDLGLAPPEDLKKPFTPPRQDLLVLAGSAFLIRKIDPESSISQADQQIFFVYGQLRYWDTLIDRKAPTVKPDETWWCSKYDPITKTFARCDNGYARNTPQRH